MRKTSSKLQKATAWLLAMVMSLSAMQPTLAYADAKTSDPATEFTSNNDSGSDGYASVDVQANEDDSSILDVKASNTKDTDQEIRLHLWEFDEGFFEDYEFTKTPAKDVTIENINESSKVTVNTKDNNQITLTYVKAEDSSDSYLEFTALAGSNQEFSISFTGPDDSTEDISMVVEPEVVEGNAETDQTSAPVALTIKAAKAVTETDKVSAESMQVQKPESTEVDEANGIAPLNNETSNDNVLYFENDNIAVTIETSLSVYREPSADDGKLLFYTGENAISNISISNMSNQSVDNSNIKIYFDTEDENFTINNMSVGDVTISSGGKDYTGVLSENGNGYILDVPVPDTGDTLSFTVTTTFPNRISSGGDVEIKAEINTQAGNASSNNAQILNWGVIEHDFSVSTSLYSTPKFEGNGENDDFAYLKSLTYSISIARTGSIIKDIGCNPAVEYLTTYTLTLPEGLSFSEEFINSENKKSYVNFHHSSAQTTTIQSVVISSDRSVAIIVRQKANSYQFSDLDDFYDKYAGANYQERLMFDDNMIVTNSTVQADNSYELNFDVQTEVHYKFNGIKKNINASTINGVAVGEGELSLSKFVDDYDDSFGNYVPIAITVENSSAVTMPVGDIEETLPIIWYIKPSDIEAMFSTEDADYLTLTITNATLCNDDQPISVTGTDGKTYETNIDNTWSESKYDGLSDVDSSSYTNDYATQSGATITFQKSDNVLVADLNSRQYEIGDGQEYETVDDFFEAIHFKVTYYAQYSVYWNNDSHDFSLVGGADKEFEIPSTYKDTFMLLTKDSLNRYDHEYEFPKTIPSMKDIANTNQSVLYYPNSSTIYKTDQDGVNDARMDFNLEKGRTINGAKVEDDASIRAGDVVEYNIKVSKYIQINHGNVTNYDIIPLVEQLSGDQVLLVPVQENADKVWANDRVTYTYKDGEYYILTEGIYQNVFINGRLADRVEVINNNGIINTLIYWYMTDYSNNNPNGYINWFTTKTVEYSYLALVTSKYADNVAGFVDNETWLGDYQGHRLHVSYGGNTITIEKDIVNEIGDVETECKSSGISEGDSVIYRLSIKSLSDIDTTISGNAISDALPLSIDEYRWAKDNISISYSDFKYISDESQEAWNITEAQGNTNQQNIQWNDDFSIILAANSTSYIWVTLAFPQDDNGFEKWTHYTENYGLTTLTNVFKLDWNTNMSSSVSHTVNIDSEAVLQKGVVSTGFQLNSYSAYKEFTDQTSRIYYRSDNSVQFYISLYNSGNSNLYLSDIIDKSSAGISNSVSSNNITSNTTYSTPTTSDNVVRKKISVSRKYDTRNRLNHFIIEGTEDGDSISYDEATGKYYLAPGEYIEFSYIVSTPGNTETNALMSTNRVAMSYYSTGDTDITLSDTAITIADNKYTPNDGTPAIISNDEAKQLGLTDESTDQKWLESEVSIYSKEIVPGVSKKITSGSDIIYGSETVQWQIKASNKGHDTMRAYTITDVIPKPFELEKGTPIEIKIYNEDYGSGLVDRTNAVRSYTIDDITYDDNNQISAIALSYKEYNKTYKYTLNRGESRQIYIANLFFDYNSNGDFYFSIQPVNTWLDINSGQYATLDYTTRYNSNTLVNETFENNVYLTPRSNQNWQGSVYEGEYLDSGVTEATKDMPTVHNLAFVTMTNGYGTTSSKTVTESDNQQNTANSNSITNYIVLGASQQTFDYTLNVNNISDHAMDQLILIDNLPQIGDHETFDSSISRDSEFKVKLSDDTDFVVTVSPNESSAGWQEFTLTADQYIIQYSTKTEFDNADWAGNGDGWTTYTAGADLSEARSIRLIIQDTAGTLIPSKSNISLKFAAEIDDENITSGMYAWNSFGYSYSMTDSDTTLMATPLKVGVAVKGIPFIEKQIIDSTGAENALDETHTFHFVLYSGDRIISVRDDASLEDMMQAINDNNREFTYITLTVDADESVSDQLQLNNLHTYTFDTENGFTETTKAWEWADDSSYTIWEVPETGYSFVSVGQDQVLNNAHTFIYNNARNQVISCVNQAAPNSFDIRVNKYYSETVGDATYAGAVKDAILQVWNADKTEMLAEQTVDETGYVAFTELEAGDYVLVEAEAPDHFVIADDIAFTVNEDGTITTEDAENVGTDDNGMYLKMKDEMEDGTIIIQKFEDDGETPLAGVTYTLYDSDDQVIDTKTTGEDGRVTFTEVPFGDYTIVETKTAEGYSLLAEPISVTIPLVMTAEEAEENDADTTQAFYDNVTDSYIFFALTYNVTDDATFVLPTTGSNNLATMAVGGIGALVILTGVYLTYRRKKGYKGILNS